MHNCGAKFQEHFFNSSRDIVYNFSISSLFSCKQYDVITDVICIIEKCTMYNDPYNGYEEDYGKMKI